ncbi:hypothetical protein V1277_001043 [Bradyrhizobium sp. AZCC 1588]|uniref:hypothetical protein n=1 Tax=unclassified Bradyrhizobium TaxID=2631580 RepID=UPI002FF0AC64
MFEFVPLQRHIGHQTRLNRNVSFYEDWRPIWRGNAAPPTFHFNNLNSRAIIAIAGWRHEL